jgi:hypothetical protein
LFHGISHWHHECLHSVQRRFEHATMHYTTIDQKKSEIRPQDHALHHHWPPKIKYSNPFSTHSCNQVYCRSYPTRDKQTSRLFCPFLSWQYILHVWVYHSQRENRLSIVTWQCNEGMVIIYQAFMNVSHYLFGFKCRYSGVNSTKGCLFYCILSKMIAVWHIGRHC